ncbi:MAG: DUF881 domain-containing protein [Abditibacteriaceae bacterium]
MSVVSRLNHQITQSIGRAGDSGKAQEAQRKNGVKVALSLTVVAFLFGAMLAVQLRAAQTLRDTHNTQTANYVAATAEVKAMQAQLIDEARNRASLQIKLAGLQDKLKNGEVINHQQLDSLNQQIKTLQVAAGLATVSGKGIVIKLSDNSNAAQGAVGAFLPGLVHDYDVLQVVNELRSAKADAISVNKTRITGYTPIRCVGPVIYVNWGPAAAPFTIDAIGDPQVLSSAMKMPGGILANLKNQGLGVKIWTSNSLTLAASEGLPTPTEAKAKQ